MKYVVKAAVFAALVMTTATAINAAVCVPHIRKGL